MNLLTRYGGQSGAHIYAPDTTWGSKKKELCAWHSTSSIMRSAMSTETGKPMHGSAINLVEELQKTVYRWHWGETQASWWSQLLLVASVLLEKCHVRADDRQPEYGKVFEDFDEMETTSKYAKVSLSSRVCKVWIWQGQRNPFSCFIIVMNSILSNFCQ